VFHFNINSKVELFEKTDDATTNEWCICIGLGGCLEIVFNILQQ